MPTKTAVRKTAPRKAVPRKAAPAPPVPAFPGAEVISTVPLGDNREVRVTRIPTGLRENLVRIGINLVPGGESMSGAVFPESQLDDVIEALSKVRGADGRRTTGTR